MRVAFFGQPGAGKSSLINAIVGRNLAEVGVRTDTTVNACTYEWNGLHLVDLPGYDTKRFPKETYSKQFGLGGFDLFVCVFDGKLHHADEELFRVLREELKKPTLVVRNKLDVLWQGGKTEEQLQEEITTDVRNALGDPSLDVLFVSCRTQRGLDALVSAIHAQLNEAKRLRWNRSAKAYSREALNRKRVSCERYVTLAAATAAANGLNPVPGLDVAVDLGVLLTLCIEIRRAYGLDDNAKGIEALAPVLMPQLAKLVAVATKQGVMVLLKRFAAGEVAKAASKFVPLVGQVVGASVGYLITKRAGDWYLNECHSLAEKVIDLELQQAH